MDTSPTLLPHPFHDNDLIRQLSDYCANMGISMYDPNAIDLYCASVQTALSAALTRPTVIFGTRTQQMFFYVASSLPSVQFITLEDNTNSYSIVKGLRRPDYRIRLINNREIFVEVKNHSPKRYLETYIATKPYLDSLRRYAKYHNKVLMFAIYWKHWNVWTLTRLSAFKKKNDKLRLDFMDAIMHNEMSMLGDFMLGTVPPLSLRFVSPDDFVCRPDAEGIATFKIGRIDVVAGGKVLTDPVQKNLATYMLMFGNWQEEHRKSDVRDGTIRSFEIGVAPTEVSGTQPFVFVGSLSEMISRQFRRRTVKDDKVTLINPNDEPGNYGVEVPTILTGLDLRLWVFHMLPKNSKRRPDFPMPSGRGEKRSITMPKKHAHGQAEVQW